MSHGKRVSADIQTADGRRSDVFVLPTYAATQLENAQRVADLAAQHGFKPVIVCNGSSAEVSLTDKPFALSAGSNTGYGGAANLVASKIEFTTIVVCNDDMCFTDAAMGELRTSVERLDRGGRAAIMGFLPRDQARVAPLPGVPGVIALVSGLSVLTRRHNERLAKDFIATHSTSDDGERLLNGLGFPFVCVAITRAAWDLLGGFDDHFPLYFEDMDVLARAYRSGRVEVSIALGECTHPHSASARTVVPYILPLMSVGARNYLRIHRRLPSVVSQLLVSFGLVLRSMFWMPVRPNRSIEAHAIFRSLRAVWSHRPAPMPPW